ncbi:pyridoxamine 5'-phosphate oxidase [Tsukamurella sp. 8F]|uniref:pyridoxamine 5'-phosphate oxidase n=1 Tax=unclassified Tsukamurella TaxID=2633480 RepID=UPI0023B8EDC0|nr:MULTISPECIES: pyridoxamine 5'-phosphate oxidase [unclassified Tsukamurella]MDF0529816.1 pyridoxamine 5'-phosphate oxidase [Tsukamurella sp. 8J]MDF0587008.1 pyridoxamine 5'-phosphate oxidase [Tsukamurella sp. 8F]
MRENYGAGPDGVLVPEDAAGGWLPLFEKWLAEAVEARVPEPNAMVVATVGSDGIPATRTVLCKGVDERGIVFYTNYGSFKGHALAAEPVAAATFPWIAMHRQVHFAGAVEKVTEAETAAYWAVRPRGSQLGAWASDQSEPIASRAELTERFVEAERRFDGADVPVPPTWGGYRIVPRTVEFWRGQANRVHDRVRLTAPDFAPVRLQP